MIYTCWWLRTYTGMGWRHLEKLGADTSLALLVLTVAVLVLGEV